MEDWQSRALASEAREAALRERVGELIQRAYHDGWADAINRDPWDDMWDWLALTEREFAAKLLKDNPHAG